MDVRVNGSGDEAILELPAYSIGQNKTHIPVHQISTYSLIDYNGIYGTEIVLMSGQRVRAGCYPDDLSRAITAANTRTNEILRLTRERDAALAEVERLRKSVEDWHDAAVRAERNAAMSQEETIKLIEKNAHLNEVNEAIKRTTKAWREDAERYRWLRDQKHEVRMWLPNGEYKFYQPTSLTNEEIDAAIDAAMREGK